MGKETQVLKRVEYTRHAQDKFQILKRHGCEITPNQVEDAVLHPELVIPQSGEKFIAQKGLTERHVLRVVYREQGETRGVITFYPGLRSRYES